MRDLIFLDTETTGLDPSKHEIWEIAWAINDEPVNVEVLVHSLKTADMNALDLNGYFLRHAGALPRSDGPWIDLNIRKILAGNTLVCANPTFDRMMMLARWSEEPYHYRAIDVESMALAVLGYDRPRGLKTIFEDLYDLGYEIEVPDHTAYNDVVALRKCYHALRNEQKKLIDCYKMRTIGE